MITSTNHSIYTLMSACLPHGRYIERELWCFGLSVPTLHQQCSRPYSLWLQGNNNNKPFDNLGIARRQKLCTESRSGKSQVGENVKLKKHDSYDVVALVLSSLIVHLLFAFFSNFIYKMSEMFVEFCSQFFLFFLFACKRVGWLELMWPLWADDKPKKKKQTNKRLPYDADYQS
jgi:hypothetical protein